MEDVGMIGINENVFINSNYKIILENSLVK